MKWLLDVQRTAKGVWLGEELIRRDFENIGEFAQDHQRRIARASFDLTDVGTIDLGHERQLLLGKVL